MLLSAAAAVITVNSEFFREKPLTSDETRNIVREEMAYAIKDANDRYPNVVLASAYSENTANKIDVKFFEQIETRVSFENAEQSMYDDYRRSKIAFAAFRFVNRLALNLDMALS